MEPTIGQTQAASWGALAGREPGGAAAVTAIAAAAASRGAS
ncbi:hypothetical protein [Conexibacter sp. CPCC 206217]|nr:hypothetical protein [Conexibacter sp. CPCC 206217]MDO8211793.1 hypothetical protein [Conexibacter sp. CPCC 206217]